MLFYDFFILVTVYKGYFKFFIGGSFNQTAFVDIN